MSLSTVRLGQVTLWCSIVLYFCSSFYLTISENERLGQMLQDFATGYAGLNLPARTLSYSDNLRNIQDEAGRERQRQFFTAELQKAKTIDPNKLTDSNWLLYRQWIYESGLNMERLELESKYSTDKTPITNHGILYQGHGKEWYRYFLKEFLSLDVEPEALRSFGMREIQKVKRQMAEVQQQLGYAGDSLDFYNYLNSSRFKITDEEVLINEFKKRNTTVQGQLEDLFPSSDVPVLNFFKIENADKDSPPGYYSREDQGFYFNFYRQEFNARNIDFLFIHEGIPGHHYQSNLESENTANPLNGLFFYMAYSEGWAAYCEELGPELGLYQTPEDYYGKLEWDLVRSARVVMDVGLNYDGWSKEQALAFWKKYIPNQDEIAEREIDRMLRWPVQVHSYKVGADAILKKKEEDKARLGSAFDIRKFHNDVLKNGPLPLAVSMSQDHSRSN